MYQEIPIDRLLPHPENSNRMGSTLLKKLEEHIKKSGNYETITARPHPELPNYFQILNGHHRVQALKKLNVAFVKCDVWAIGDLEARLLMATLNRLEGQDVPELRAILLAKLAEVIPISDLGSILPENQKQLQKMLLDAELNIKSAQQRAKEYSSHLITNIPDLRILDFILDSVQYHRITASLDGIIEREHFKDRGEALFFLCERFEASSLPEKASCFSSQKGRDPLYPPVS